MSEQTLLEPAAPARVAEPAETTATPVAGPRRGRRRRAIATTVVVVALASAAGGARWWHGHDDATATAITTTATRSVEVVTTGAFTTSVSAEGTVAAAGTESLNFASAGTVTAVHVKVGDTVTAGRVLAEIESPELAAALAEAQAAQADAAAQIAADQEALDDDADAVTAEQQAAHVAREQVASDALRDAYLAYFGRHLTASIDGAVTAVNLTIGEQLASGGTGGISASGSGSGSGNSIGQVGGNSQPGTTGGDTSSAHIEIVSIGHYQVALVVDSTEIDSVDVGQTVALTEAASSSVTTGGFGGFPGGGAFPGGGVFPGGGGLPGGAAGDTDDTGDTAGTLDDGFSVTGTVIKVAGVADASSGVASYTVTVEFEDASGDVYVGSSVLAEIETSRRTGVVQAPVQAVATAGGVSTVLVTPDGTTDGELETRTVTTGAIQGTMIEIVDGLTPGEQVVIERTAPSGLPTGGGPVGGGLFPGGLEMGEGGLRLSVENDG